MMRSKTTIATPPGATIKEQLVDRHMNQKEFSVRMSMSEKHISKLINGEVQLTPDVAIRLEMVLGIPAHFWINLESIYREKLSRVKAENEMEEEIAFSRNLPYNEMAKQKWVPETRKPVERVVNLRKFFEIVKLNILEQPLVSNIVYRKLGKGIKSDYALVAWAQKAKLESRAVETAAIDIVKLKKMIPEIRMMTTQDPSFFCSLLIEKMRGCGIALIFLPHIGGTFLHGATFCEGSKIVIGMTVRGKDADRFWFSFFHELGHIILKHTLWAEGITEEEEREADAFARNALIPDDKFEEFINRKDFSKASIERFAEEIGIAPGIVVGRLQKEEWIPFSLCNDLKTKYQLTA